MAAFCVGAVSSTVSIAQPALRPGVGSILPASRPRRAPAPRSHGRIQGSASALCLVTGLAALRHQRRSLRRAAAPQPPVFECRSRCGVPSTPFAAAPVQSRGTPPVDGHGAFVAVPVSMTGQKGLGQAVNQDCIAAQQCADGRWVCVVADGHGENGHRCAEQICGVLPGMLTLARSMGSGSAADAIGAAFQSAEVSLESVARSEAFSIEGSGAAVGLLLIEPDGSAHLASCGDCRVMIIDLETGDFSISHVHKGHDADEKARLEGAGARVEIEEEGGVAVFSRVYAPGGNSGLAMSRAFGDLELKRYGVVAEPSVETVQMPSKACCLLGSDGLFDFIPPEQLAKVLTVQIPVHGAGVAAEQLVAEAKRRAMLYDPGYCDDVTCFILRPPAHGSDHTGGGGVVEAEVVPTNWPTTPPPAPAPAPAAAPPSKPHLAMVD